MIIMAQYDLLWPLWQTVFHCSDSCKAFSTCHKRSSGSVLLSTSLGMLVERPGPSHLCQLDQEDGWWEARWEGIIHRVGVVGQGIDEAGDGLGLGSCGLGSRGNCQVLTPFLNPICDLAYFHFYEIAKYVRKEDVLKFQSWPSMF